MSITSAHVAPGLSYAQMVATKHVLVPMINHDAPESILTLAGPRKQIPYKMGPVRIVINEVKCGAPIKNSRKINGFPWKIYLPLLLIGVFHPHL